MKKIILSMSICLILISCYATKAPVIQLGMSVEEFTKSAKYEELVTLDEEWAIYKVKYGFNAENIRFYYFKNNKLVKMDSGERATDYRVRIDVNQN